MENARTNGTQGPDLDAAFAPSRRQGYDESTIEELVLGQIKFAAPPMPQNLVTGQDAVDVAAYVAACAANADACQNLVPASELAKTNDPKELFNASCASCHTFAAAGSTGNIGPNLDQVNTPLDEAREQIANGGGGMPAFKDQLTKKQIDALAKFVAG